MGIDPPAMTMFDSTVLLPDAFLQLTAPSFEYPRENLPSSVRCVGALPIVPNQAPLPPWADEIDGSRDVVLVTQGTFSNHDFTELVAPTLAALAEEPDRAGRRHRRRALDRNHPRPHSRQRASGRLSADGVAAPP